MNALQIVALLVVAVAGAGVVSTRDPLSQSVAASFYGSALAVLFLVLQAPDVALSTIIGGAVVFPLMLLLTLGKIRGGAE